MAPEDGGPLPALIRYTCPMETLYFHPRYQVREGITILLMTHKSQVLKK